jgi:hypothetical protein
VCPQHPLPTKLIILPAGKEEVFMGPAPVSLNRGKKDEYETKRK